MTGRATVLGRKPPRFGDPCIRFDDGCVSISGKVKWSSPFGLCFCAFANSYAAYHHRRDHTVLAVWLNPESLQKTRNGCRDGYRCGTAFVGGCFRTASTEPVVS